MPFSGKQRAEDIFLLASYNLTMSVTTVTGIVTAVNRAPVDCQIDHMFIGTATGGATGITQTFTMYQRTGVGAVSGGTLILGSSATAVSLSGATVDKAGVLLNIAYSSAFQVVTAPSDTTTGVFGTNSATAWFIARGTAVGIILASTGAPTTGSCDTVRIWATRRGEA